MRSGRLEEVHPPSDLIQAWQPILDLVGAARDGHIEPALDGLERLLRLGDVRAAIPLAEIYAFHAEWKDCLQSAGVSLEHPEHALSLAIFPEMAELAALAAREGELWLPLDTRLHRSREVLWEWQDSAGRNQWLAILDRIQDWSAREGAPPDPAIAPLPLYPSHPDGRNPDDAFRQTKFETRIRNTTRLRPHVMEDPVERARTELFWAISFRLPEVAFRVAAEHPAIVAFEDTLFLAASLIERGEPAAAWERIAAALPRWNPADRAQVAPVALLTHPVIRPIMTAERRAAVLARNG
ncbi:MAG: hypothetical protein R2729_02420 [Bryobacteraceae bacterium]